MRLADEFQTIELGEQCLNRRAVLLAERLGQNPSVSIPNAGAWLGTNCCSTSLLFYMARKFYGTKPSLA
ncbi:transposase DNA-binding-containing protein [Simplicispira metamorpha]|uniref:Transposase-like DNA-binding protein n=1 Tax=Simplicispira metamorpha TaxID=80881 RepID=A0A4R2MXA7_9BURK|nr:transposase DNA-binding-containing protein [Simplicispira metamorpha]TCP12551.1 transposase-like DNA-binding protein [Simplicispira metamorpha]